MLYPLTFRPIFKERVWGGRHLEQLYGKPLPPKAHIGESWEISDRPGDVSVIDNGPLIGKNLHWLMVNHRRDLLGNAKPATGDRFPLLIKLLDAREKLSLQVHPPAQKAATLGGEPKTEMWYIADAEPGADLYVGLKRGVARADFEKKIQTGEVAECFHRLPVKRGDAMFLPSGRVHAIGAGLVIFEIQQNSDTTYRVFDWNRVGLDGKPRDVHVAQSLESIDFNDFEPALVKTSFSSVGPAQVRQLVADPLFRVDVQHFQTSATVLLKPGRMSIVGVLEGSLAITGGTESVDLQPGQFCLVPAAVKMAEVWAKPGCSFLLVQSGE